MSRKKTHFEYVSEVELIASNIEVLGKYTRYDQKIKHKCKLCGYEWDAKPTSILNGHGCPECAKYQRARSNTKTHEQFVAEVKLTNPFVEIIGKYTNSSAKVKVKCKECGNQWFARAADILRGHGCSKCSRTKTHEQYVSELAAINPNIAVIDKYINSYTKIKHLCLKCGHEWSAKPNSILQGNNCPECSAHRKPQELYITELAIINPTIEVIDEYVNANTNIMHKCTICGYQWMLRPSHALHGLGCPSCQETSGEQRVRQWLITNNIEYEYQKRFSDCKNQRMLPFDFYLPDYNCCIEYDGAQHFREVALWGGQEYLSKRQCNDQIKNDYCKEKNINLIRIRYDENVCDVLNNELKPIFLNIV